jgi:adenylate cyclase
VDAEALIEAGLYDPAAPGAPDRFALLEYVLAAGATLDEMLDADAGGNLTGLVTDLHLRRGELSAVDLGERTGCSLDEVLETYRLLGVAVDNTTEPLFDGQEVRLLELITSSAVALPEGMTDEILRSIGSALTIVAESAVSAFVGSVEDSLAELEDQRQRAEITTATASLGLELGTLLGPLLRHHLRAAVRRQRASMQTSRSRLDTTVCVGFIDLVGFTTATAVMGADELLEFMRRFHSRTFDIVTAAGGRVVKYIGDEVMFSAVDIAEGCAIGLDLVEAYGETTSQPRGGLAYGAVVSRHGDYYGPVVNLAARLTDIAVPGEVLAGSEVGELLDGSPFEAEPAGRRVLKGFTEPVAVATIRRRSRG